MLSYASSYSKLSLSYASSVAFRRNLGATIFNWNALYNFNEMSKVFILVYLFTSFIKNYWISLFFDIFVDIFGGAQAKESKLTLNLF